MEKRIIEIWQELQKIMSEVREFSGNSDRHYVNDKLIQVRMLKLEAREIYKNNKRRHLKLIIGGLM